MILSIGEILVDMIGKEDCYAMKCGGAPFNVAANAVHAGGEACFIGKVGDDIPGAFLKKQAGKYGLSAVDIITTSEHNTTLAFVSHTCGERDFCFYRCNTADYSLTLPEINFSLCGKPTTIHVGSLMLSSEQGRKLSRAIAEYALANKIRLSFDVNLRASLFSGDDKAREAYRYMVENADVIKFSEDELLWYADTTDLTQAISKVYVKGTLMTVTQGKYGCLMVYDGEVVPVPTVKQLKPVDTTGAGDAFFGALLAYTDGKKMTKERLISALQQANAMGAEATQYHGALGHILK